MQVEASSENACPHCKSPNSTNSRFCSACGTRIQAEAVPSPSLPSSGVRKTCPGCNKINDAAAQFCLHCGTKLPATAAVPAFGEPAGFWIRGLALLIDGIVLYALGWLAEERLGVPHDVIGDPQGVDAVLQVLPGVLLDAAIGLVFCTLMVGRWGATVGKMICGLRIVRADGGRVTYGLSLTRYFAEFLSGLPLGLGYIWVLLSPSKRAWHDYLCDTRVVFRRPS